MKTIKLTYSEIRTILQLIHENEQEGYYYGNKEQYFRRLDRIKKKMETE